MTRKNNHQEIDASADLEKIRDRRRVLKKITAGGTIVAGTSLLPVRWVAPVVERIMVPAHAQTSVTTTKAPATTTTTTTTPCPEIEVKYQDSWQSPNFPDTIYRRDVEDTIGGTSPYTYAFTNELSSPSCDETTIDPNTGTILTDGNCPPMTVTATDANGCTGTVEVIGPDV